MSFSFDRLYMERHKVWAVTVLCILFYYMLVPANLSSIKVLRDSFYLCVVPVLVAAVLYFRGLQDGIEFKLLLAFWIWFWFSRALNGSPTLDHDFDIFIDLSLMIPFFVLGLALSDTEKKHFLDWLCTVIGGFYFVIGLIALVAFLRCSVYYLPIVKAPVGIVPETGYGRIIILDDNSNITAFWYLSALFLMVYQLFHTKKKIWRIPILFSAGLDLLVIVTARSRSIWFCTALTLAMLTAILLLRPLQSKSRFFRIVIVSAAAALVLIGSYEIAGLGADAMTRLSYRITDSRLSSSKATPQGSDQEKTDWAEGHRSIHPTALSSGKRESPEDVRLYSNSEQNNPPTASGDQDNFSFSRRQIWHGAFQTIRTMPSILWRGHIIDSIIIDAYGFIADGETGHIPWNFYNSLIQVLMITGLPGLFLVISFLALVLYRGFRFSLCVSAPLDSRTMILPVIATMPYFMLEAGLFTAIDLRTLFYFLICGLMIGSAREHTALSCPRLF